MVTLTTRAATAGTMLLLALTGCGGEPTTAAAAAVSPSPSPSPSPSASPSPSPSAAPTTHPVATTPTCKNTKGWSVGETLAWVRPLVRYDTDVQLGSYDLTDTVCTAIGVQVQFWNISFTTTVAGVSYDMKSVLRKQVPFDGRRHVSVAPPGDLGSGDCAGYVMAVYVGKPLTDSELPETIDFSGPAYLTNEIEFRTDRVVTTYARLPTSDFGPAARDAFLDNC
jgi:hypothetical protein